MSDKDIRPWSERALEAEARVQQLEEALRFYADEENYRLKLMRHTDGNHSYKYVIQDVDKGEKARAALPPSKEDTGE